MKKLDIPFNKPFVSKLFPDILESSISSRHFSGDGPMTNLASGILKSELNTKNILLTPSCTHALELALQVLHLQVGDEVILPSYTFSSTANSIILSGGIPVFVDVSEKTLNIDPKEIEKAITARTRAILIVHYAGVAVKLDEISQIANANNLILIEDNAHGLFGKYKNNYLGSFGEMSALSFHETKNIHCGEGGALQINSDNYLNFAETFREKGTNRSQYFRGQIDKYNWVSSGSSLLLSDLLASFLVSQLNEREFIQTKRIQIWDQYFLAFNGEIEKYNFKIPHIPESANHPGHIFYLRCPSLETRSKLIEFAKENGIGLAFHYQALHASPAGKLYARTVGKQHNSLKASDDLVRLPIWPDMTFEQVYKVADVVLKFINSLK